MTAKILDGAKIRDAMFGELKDEVAILSSAGIRPGLAAVLVGNDPASQLYVKSKIAACEQLGMGSGLITPPSSATTAEMLAIVEDLNRDNDTDGILIQLPLPAQVDTKRVLEAVDPAKDVDGFHPVNLGRLVSGRPGLVACTPAGCMEILRRNEIAIEGANAVVLGRSDIVGKPMALLLDARERDRDDLPFEDEESCRRRARRGHCGGGDGQGRICAGGLDQAWRGGD